MSISINCQCGRTMLISEELEGLPVRCPNCGRKHLVPKYEPLPVAKPITKDESVIEINKPVCTHCKQEIEISAKFCPNCGRRVLNKPAKKEPVIKKVENRKDIEKQIPIRPEIFPGPFRSRKNRPNAHQVFNGPFRNCHRERVCGRKKEQFVKNVMINAKNDEIAKPEKKTSGLAKFGFFTGFISLIIALLSVLVATHRNALPQHVSMHNMNISIGMMEVGMIFALIAGISAVLAIFHFSRRRFLLIFLTLIFIFGTVGVVGKVHKCEKMHKEHKIYRIFEHHPRFNGIQNEIDIDEITEEFDRTLESLESKNDNEIDDKPVKEQTEPDKQESVEPKPDNDVKQKKAIEDF